jgi:hypothetical protein
MGASRAASPLRRVMPFAMCLAAPHADCVAASYSLYLTDLRTRATESDGPSRSEHDPVAASRALVPIGQSASNQLARIVAISPEKSSAARFAQEISVDPRRAAEAYRRQLKKDLTGLILSRCV